MSSRISWDLPTCFFGLISTGLSTTNRELLLSTWDNLAFPAKISLKVKIFGGATSGGVALAASELFASTSDDDVFEADGVSKLQQVSDLTGSTFQDRASPGDLGLLWTS